jgi:hypothetical protein
MTAVTGLVEGDLVTKLAEDTGLVDGVSVTRLVKGDPVTELVEDTITGLVVAIAGLVEGDPVTELVEDTITGLVDGDWDTGLLVAGESVTGLVDGDLDTGLLVAGESVTGVFVMGVLVTEPVEEDTITGLVDGGSVTGLLEIGESVTGLVVAHILTSVHVPSDSTQQPSPSHVSNSGQSSPLEHPVTREQIPRGTYPSKSGQVYLMHGSVGTAGELVVGVISDAGAMVGTTGESVGGGWSCSQAKYK